MQYHQEAINESETWNRSSRQRTAPRQGDHWEEDDDGAFIEETKHPRQRERLRSTRVTSNYLNKPLIERLAPPWAKKAAAFVATLRDPDYRVAAIFMAVILLVFGLVLLLGGGYTSIQGLRKPLALAGLSITDSGFPPIYWWSWPIIITFTEIIARKIEGFRLIWWTAYIFDGATTGFFFTQGIYNILANTGVKSPSVILVGSISALLGLIVAVLAEQLAIAGFYIIQSARKPR